MRKPSSPAAGDARLQMRELAERAFLDALTRLGGEAPVALLAEVLHRDRSAVQRTAKRLADQGRIARRLDPPRVLYRLLPPKRAARPVEGEQREPSEKDWRALDATFARLSRLRA